MIFTFLVMRIGISKKLPNDANATGLENTLREPVVWSVGVIGRPIKIRVKINLIYTEGSTLSRRIWK